MVGNQAKVSRSIRQMISGNMEVFHVATNLKTDVESYSANVGLYLVSNNKDYRQLVHRDATAIVQKLSLLRDLIDSRDDELRGKIEDLAGTYAKIANLTGEILKTTDDPILRIPGLAMARGHLAHSCKQLRH